MNLRDATTARRATFNSVMLLGGFALVSALLLLLQADGLVWRSPGAERWLDCGLVIAAWLALLGWLRHRRRQEPRKHLGVLESVSRLAVEVVAHGKADACIAVSEVAVRVIYASQT
ncbi:MAG: sulfite reductase flavoprotein subunit alpha, partial [Rhodanobacter sp.]